MQGLQRTHLWLWWKGLGNPLWKGYPRLCIARNTENDVKGKLNRISVHFERSTFLAVRRIQGNSKKTSCITVTESGPFSLLETH